MSSSTLRILLPGLCLLLGLSFILNGAAPKSVMQTSAGALWVDPEMLAPALISPPDGERVDPQPYLIWMSEGGPGTIHRVYLGPSPTFSGVKPADVVRRLTTSSGAERLVAGGVATLLLLLGGLHLTRIGSPGRSVLLVVVALLIFPNLISCVPEGCVMEEDYKAGGTIAAPATRSGVTWYWKVVDVQGEFCSEDSETRSFTVR